MAIPRRPFEGLYHVREDFSTAILKREAVEPMRRTIQVRTGRGERQFVAECLDLPVVTQAATLDELALNIRGAIG